MLVLLMCTTCGGNVLLLLLLHLALLLCVYIALLVTVYIRACLCVYTVLACPAGAGASRKVQQSGQLASPADQIHMNTAHFSDDLKTFLTYLRSTL